jgi:hypothetical protein
MPFNVQSGTPSSLTQQSKNAGILGKNFGNK